MDQATSPLRPLSPSSEQLTAEIASVIANLREICDRDGTSLQSALAATESLLRLRHTFIDTDRPREAKDAFRCLYGFQTLLDFAGKVSDVYDINCLSREERKDFLILYKDVLEVLAESLRDHFGNKRYFAKRIAGGGTAVLEAALATLVKKIDNTDGDTEQLYGCILAAALCQETVADLFTTLAAVFQRNAGQVPLKDVLTAVDKRLGTTEIIEAPEFLGPFLRLWLIQSSSSKHEVLRLALPACLYQLASQSLRNTIALHATGMLTSILPILFTNDRPENEKSLYNKLAQLLCVQGMSNLNDAVDLYRKACDSSDVLRFLLDSIKCSKEPPSIHFDMSLHGYCSVEFSTLGRLFPSTASSGYTLAVWARFEQFDSSTHTTIFGAFDASQTCFVLAYLEKDTRHFILQTSIRGPRPSVRFKSFAFEPRRWYHICVVHKRPRPTSSSRAALFIDGRFVEQQKIEYPCAPAGIDKSRRVQAFFGTPQDLAVRLGRGVSTSRWSLANAILFDESYSDDLIAVFYNLGPRYYGNFQDCLGSFQTYKASAVLNLRNEQLHAGKEDSSDIVTAIRRKASSLVREDSILINISPTSILDDDDSNNVDESQLVKSLSKQAAKNLHHLTKAGGNPVAVNGVTPAINDALTQPHGIGILTGDPVVSVPQSLDDVSWRIGGCTSVHLSLVQAARSAECMLLAVETLYEAVQDNWRNSEAMERDNGYGILAALLREKLGFALGNSATPSKSSIVCSSSEERSALALELLRLTLKFVGYDLQRPDCSIIINPLAYRVLLVDLDIWRFGDLPVLQLYYSQFTTFAAESQFRRFNAKRLARMRVNKKLLESLKGDGFTQDALPLFVSAFRSLLDSSLSADLLRSLALFITYAIHKPKPSAKLQKKRSLRFASRPDQSVLPFAIPVKYVSSPRLAVEILRMYCSLLCNPDDPMPLKKFARAVTNKWLLYLMCEEEPEIVFLATKMMARLIVVHGSSYSKKFAEKTGGYRIMQYRLKRWWNIPALWPVCFAILFGIDVALLKIDRPFDRFELLHILSLRGEPKIIFPEILSVIAEMMQSGLKKAVLASEIPKTDEIDLQECLSRLARPSMSSFDPVGNIPPNKTPEEILILTTVVEFLAELHVKSRHFRDFAAQSIYVEKLLFVLFPVVVGSDIPSAEVELNSRDGELGFDENSLVIRPRSNTATELRTTRVEESGPRDENGGPLKRGSSFILVSSNKAKYLPSSARLRHVIIPNVDRKGTICDHPIVKGVLSLVLAVFSDHLFERKDFTGLGFYAQAPPAFPDDHAYFVSWSLQNLLSTLKDALLSHNELLWEPRTLNNLGRLVSQVREALYEGWFVNGAISTLDFAGSILEYLQQPDVARSKSIRLCSQAVTTIVSTLFRVVLLKLSESDDSESASVLRRLIYWQAVLLSAGETQSENLQLLCYLLYTKLISDNDDVRRSAANLWRVILVQKPTEMSTILSQATVSLQKRLSGGLETLVGLDDAAFLEWVDEQRDDLDALFFGVLSKTWESFVQGENSSTEESARSRISKRREKLKQWMQAEKLSDELIRKQEVTFNRWVSNISASEFLKYQRILQDQQDDSAFMWSAFSHLSMDLRRFGGVLAERKEKKWRLDHTEGRSRMRLRVVPDDSGERQDYQPKRKASEPPVPKLDMRVRSVSNGDTLALTPTALASEPADGNPQAIDSDNKEVLEESFEMIDDPSPDVEDYEDRNRKVMRSLYRGDQVQNVCNMSRVIGLEACEGLLILGKDRIYILDNFFQRADGEIVNVWQAPSEERDPYVRMIAGRESVERKSQDHETRNWKWSDVVSVSKRRFLFRDVALEIFFTDGGSYLITFISSRIRDDLYAQLAAKAPQITGSIGHLRPEDAWRFETLRSQEDAPQTLGSKFASVFGHSPAHPVTRKWIKGEISNFHYLMLLNTLAGRTFNDLTQYPVFPWVLADYTSEELDLTNPRTFRDLSKPMGCQTLEREAEFRERYRAFAEMGDDNSPPFHYGTHYSSAMIVSSYLIRLQPFVKSYLLLQGGTFDHADRLFYSVSKAWESASRGNMSDVRELIPEFFYLPEFLMNLNKYDFGLLQNNTAIDSVELPPWAKGDPKIFIAKHREALESPYVTQNLHQWIDLVFGCKQKGEAAEEAVNVFHHLSYQGSKDIDNINDPVERLATIGIIHNFGQTPHQIFSRPHPPREDKLHRDARLDHLAESLTQLPVALLDIEERVSSLSMKQDRLLCTAALRLNIPPLYDRYMEWGFFDGSVRFYSSESRKLLGHFEHLHIGQLSCAVFADSRTLITSGTDCTICIWTFTLSAKSVDLQPVCSLFGHRSPVTVLAVSRSFSTLLSASVDGQIVLWDLNQHCFVRELPANGTVECARINDVTGDIMVCRGNRISLYTLNGELLAEETVYEAPDDPILTCMFYEGVNDEWLERDLLFTGHRRGIVNIWSKTIRSGRFELDLVRQLHHVDSNRDDGANISAGISCVLALPNVVYTGDEMGRVYEWSCIPRP